MLDKILFSVAYAGIWNRWDGIDEEDEYYGGESMWSFLPGLTFLIVSSICLGAIISKIAKVDNETAGVLGVLLSLGLIWEIPSEMVRLIGGVEFFIILTLFFPKIMSALATLYAVPFGIISLLCIFRGDYFNIITGSFIVSVVVALVGRWWGAIMENRKSS